MTKPKALALMLAACLLLTSCSLFSRPAENTAPVASPGVPETPAPQSSPEPSPSPEPTFAIETDRQDAIYNHYSYNAIYLYMDKADIESVYKPGVETENGLTPYDNYGFYIRYYGNDTVKEIVVFEKPAWETFNGIGIGSTEAELKAAYGQPLSSENDTYIYYTLENEILHEAPSLAEVDINYLFTLTFILVDGLVNCIMLSRF